MPDYRLCQEVEKDILEKKAVLNHFHISTKKTNKSISLCDELDLRETIYSKKYCSEIWVICDNGGILKNIKLFF